MRGRIKANAKAGIIILLFSVLITCVFAGTMLWFEAKTNQTEIEKGGIYVLSSQEYADAILSGGKLQINAESLMGTKQYQTVVFEQFIANLFPVSLVFLSVLFILSVCLWAVLKKMHTNRTLKIAQELHDSTTEIVLSDEPVLAAAYAKLKEKFDNQLNDFKRLSAYLTHEQKNEVAILRTRMELSGNTDGLEKLDDIAGSIDDILTLSENDNQTTLTNVDVSIICAEVFDSYKRTADNLSFEFDGNDDTEILAKTRWIYRAVSNLLDNAIKYGEGKPIILSVMAKNGSVIVAVRDHGIGISADKQEMIFTEHYRVNELNKDGYGIGLSLVSHVCDLCGGFTTVCSEMQKGSVFYMSFPQKPF